MNLSLQVLHEVVTCGLQLTDAVSLPRANIVLLIHLVLGQCIPEEVVDLGELTTQVFSDEDPVLDQVRVSITRLALGFRKLEPEDGLLVVLGF